MLPSSLIADACRAGAEAAAGEEAADWLRFAIGASVKAIVHERKDYGVIVDLVEDPNLVGLIPLHQVRPHCKVHSAMLFWEAYPISQT